MSSTPTYKNLDALVEQPDSGQIESTRTGFRRTYIYTAKLAVAEANIGIVGAVGTGDVFGYVLESSTVTALRGGLGKLTNVWAAGGADADPDTLPLPPDEVAVSPTNQSPRIERHPRYTSLAAIGGELANVESALRAQDAAAREAAYSALSTLGKELVDKIRAGNESYYLASLRYSWATHSFSVPSSTRGGYVDSISGPLASYFVAGIEWLREADDLQYSNGIWRLTQSWLGADAWDADLYS